MIELSILNEEEILNLEYRQHVIHWILSRETADRKNESLKRHELYRGLSRKWIEDSLRRENLSDDTVSLMVNRASNVSILRKISNKIAKCYAGGAVRTCEDVTSTESIEALSDELDINTILDKADKYSYFDNNALVFAYPELAKLDEEGNQSFKLSLKALPSYSYDVLTDAYYPSKPKCIILSQFPTGASPVEKFIKEGQTGREGSVQSYSGTSRGDTLSIQQKNWKGVWWTNKYHFTTDIDGNIISPLTPNPETDNLNPIQLLPFVPITSESQDACYWVRGGNDLVDGDLWINKTITDLSTIAYVQGWGQPVMTGKDLPKVVHAGPNKCIMLEQKDASDPTPQFFFAQASPDITAWLSFVEQYTALLLSTRNLSPRNVSAKLDASNAASGIALLIELSESTDDIHNKQREFQDKEPVLWDIISRWHSLYHSQKHLISDLMEVAPIKDTNVKVKFLPIAIPVTESERLDNLKKRSDLGIATLKDLLMLDNPDLTTEEAEAKALELENEKKANMQAFGIPADGEEVSVEDEVNAAFGKDGEPDTKEKDNGKEDE